MREPLECDFCYQEKPDVHLRPTPFGKYEVCGPQQKYLMCDECEKQQKELTKAAVQRDKKN